MKRILSLILSLMLMLSLAACGAPANEPVAKDAPESASTPTPEQTAEPVRSAEPPSGEYKRAVWYGFVPGELADTDPESAVTWAQYCKLLGSMIAAYDESKLPEWESMTKSAPDTAMKRDGAAIALLFAARTMGIDWYNKNPGDLANEAFSAGEHYSWDYPIFPWDTTVAMNDDSMGDACDNSNAIAPSYWFLLGRVSCVTIQQMLEVNAGDPDLEAPLTYRDACISVVRLYESTVVVALKLAEAQLVYVKQTQEGAEIIAKAEARKQEILNTETKIVKSDTYIQGETYTGTAYYVSNSGDDNADGLTPETAFATLERLGDVAFEFGDAIFFERGGLWRAVEISKYIIDAEGLTLSAYGTGEKPRFYGSPESGAGKEKWELYYEGENDEKIWKFYKEMTDCSAVILNGQERILRDLAYWDGSSFRNMEDLTIPYDMEQELKDMELFTLLPYTQKPVGNEEMEGVDNMLGVAFYVSDDGESLLKGPLYVRCDKGNPGELYEEVEFIAAYQAFGGMSDYTTLDNLCIGYSTGSICGGYWEGVSNDHITIQNCIAGWMGGALNWFSARQEATSLGDVHMDGGGFNLNGSYETMQNNYSHHIFQESCTFETFDGDPDPSTDIVIRDNVIEYAVMGYVLINWETDESSPHMLKNVLFENNYALYSGFESLYNVEYPHKGEEYGGTHWPGRLGRLILDTTAFSARWGGENYRITGNTFAFSASSLLKFEQTYIPVSPVYDGNVYAPLPGFPIVHTLLDACGPLVANMDTEAVIRDELGDKNAILVTFD